MASIKIIKTVEAFCSIKSTWEMLFSVNDDLPVFQSFEWNYSVWTRYHMRCIPAEQLYVVHAKHEHNKKQELILPFCISDDGILRFIGHTMADVLDAISPRHEENWHVFYLSILKYLMSQKECKGINLARLRGASELLQYVGVYWKKAKVFYCDSYSYFNARQNVGLETFSYLSSSERSELRRIYSKTSNIPFKIYAKENGDEYPKDKILELRDWMIANKMRVYASCPNEYIDCMESLYQQNKCEVSCFEDVEGTFLCAAHRVYSHNRINYWIVLYKENRLVTAGDIHYFLKKNCKGDYCYDLGTGAYFYKLRTFYPNVEHLFGVESKPFTFKNFYLDIIVILRRYVKAWLIELRILKKVQNRPNQ